jgi:hypothetical protein
MLMGRGPKVLSFFGAAAGFSNSFFLPPPESWYPRWLYLRSDKSASCEAASFSAIGEPGTRACLVQCSVVSYQFSVKAGFHRRDAEFVEKKQVFRFAKDDNFVLGFSRRTRRLGGNPGSH